MGALQAFTGAMQLGPIAGPIVGGILAGLVVATTAVTVSNISKQKFDGGTPEITPINTDVNLGDTSGGTTAAAAGGFTSFNPGLTGNNTPGGTTTTGGGGTGTTTPALRVYVVDQDITNSQNSTRTIISNATFG